MIDVVSPGEINVWRTSAEGNPRSGFIFIVFILKH